MQITVSGQKMEVTDALRGYVEEKVQRLERHFDQTASINVVMHVDKNMQSVEGTVQTKGATLHADSCDDDMYAAIDGLIDKLDRQLLKHKGRMVDHHRVGGALKNQPFVTE